MERQALPSFLVIGCMKGGTTSLYRYLSQHPDVFVSTPKELHFFTRHWDRGREWYEQHFVSSTRAVRGEVSPSYTAIDEFPAAAERIAALLPRARLVYLARDPWDRAISHYRHEVVERRERNACPDAVRPGSPYVRRSCHAVQLRPYLDRFPRDQLLVVASERLRSDRGAAMAEILEFIGADPGAVPALDLEAEHHQTTRKLETPQWHPVLQRWRRQLVANPQVRDWVRRLPRFVKRSLVRIGTARPDARTGALLATVPTDGVPEPVQERFRKDVARLGEFCDLGRLPWTGRYT